VILEEVVVSGGGGIKWILLMEIDEAYCKAEGDIYSIENRD
jgi:hypothetical protein